ncbi:DUF5671 domain-containing protein [Mycetocola miduiensis]|uniref:DUF5671 domain-containing protein n=1 Tax=Mycetocola miduiensis TaxID=995034 RepID=A0A1I5BHX2_9MICO|nr:DUF5671 domain-containing protein [Mycetocola miduiensis]SFN74159.1 hypothetical protein SAMN05216219_1888 [Mycetocola miduiensis]
MSAVQAPYAPAPGPTAGQTVRRLIVYTLLFVLVVITAIGVQTLLSLVLGPDTLLVGNNTSTIAQGLAFTLIGGPLAGVLWWILWRRLADPAERGAIEWGLYISAVLVVALVSSSTALLSVIASLIDGDWDALALGTGLVWAAVWVWHRWMWRHPSKGPVELVTLPLIIGAAFGLVLGSLSAITLLNGIFTTAIRDLTSSPTIGGPWWIGTLQALVWAVGGGAVWAWHWYREGARTTTNGLANVFLILFGILLASVASLGGIGTVLYVVLRLLFDNSEPVGELLSPLGLALAAAAVGTAVWTYHRAVAIDRSPSTRQASILATSGVALVGAASGLGVVVNSALGILSTPLAGEGLRPLLLGGLSALLVGGVAWILSWRPLRPADASRLTTGRRIYLIAVFGISAIVALITLLVIGFQVFQVVLQGGSGLIDQIRAPLGLLTATALVAGYHFAVWREDQADAVAPAPASRRRTIGEVILVTAADPAPFVQAIQAVTGASVAVWRMASAGPGTLPGVEQELAGVRAQGPLPVPPPIEDLPLASSYTPAAPAGVAAGPAADAERLMRALEGVTGRRVLVLLGPGPRLEVVPLVD